MTASRVPVQGSIAVLVRFAVYALTVGLALQIVVVAAQRHGAVALVSEDGPVELAQAALAALAASILLTASARRSAQDRELFTLLGLACLFAVARELDGFFRELLGPHGYQVLAAPIGAAAAVHAWRSRSVLPLQAARFATTPAGVLVFAGALIVLVHAQVLGQKEVWEALVPAGDARTVKKTVEECSELTGYLLILFAAMETALARPHRAREETLP